MSRNSKKNKKAVKHKIKMAVAGNRINEGVRLNIEKEKMREKAFELRYENRTLTQEEATKLNNQLGAIIEKLIKYGYTPEDDSLIDFDNFVETSPNYQQFCW